MNKPAEHTASWRRPGFSKRALAFVGPVGTALWALVIVGIAVCLLVSAIARLLARRWYVTILVAAAIYYWRTH